MGVLPLAEPVADEVGEEVGEPVGEPVGEAVADVDAVMPLAEAMREVGKSLPEEAVHDGLEQMLLL